MTIQEQIDMNCLIDELPFCGCGSATNVSIVLLVLERAEQYRSMLIPCEDASSRWVEFAAHILDHFGYIEHGTSIRISSLTQKGKVLLSFLRKFGVEQEKWPKEMLDTAIELVTSSGMRFIGNKDNAKEVA